MSSVLLHCLFTVYCLFVSLSLFKVFESFITMPTEVVQGFRMFLLMGGQVTFVHSFKPTVFVETFP